jgi:hypothetical protein
MPVTVEEEPDSGYVRLEQQIAWYDRKSMDAQRWYKRVRFAQVLVTATIPVAGFLQAPPLMVALGGLVLVLETLQSLNQWQQNWTGYRSTCEALRHEKYVYLGHVAPYTLGDADDHRMLVQRVEALVSTEHAKWVGRLAEATRRDRDAAHAEDPSRNAVSRSRSVPPRPRMDPVPLGAD